MTRAALALSDGLTFEGEAFGAGGECVGEVVFNTALTGYQEILSDPSYAGQIVCMTYPEIGSYGINPEDSEASRTWARGLVVREMNPRPSNWRSKQTLDEYLSEQGMIGLSGIDTRMLVRHIRDTGAQMAVLSTTGDDVDALVAKARAAPSMEGMDLASEVTCTKAYLWDDPGGVLDPTERASPDGGPYKVVAYDFGVKRSILSLLHQAGCDVTVVPAATDPDEVLGMKPEGVFLSNGPGDPAAVPGAAQRTAKLIGKVPMFGICLGCQIIGLALGGRTYKLQFGHHGANHPVKDLTTGRIEITSQNHGFAIDADSLAERAVITHVNLNDATIEGIAVPDLDLFAVQYHPEASPGPHDSRYLFGRFVQSMQVRRTG